MKERKWLKEIRKKQCFTQLQAANKSNITRSYYTMIEQGKRTPKPQTAMDIAKALGFNWTIFFENNSNDSLQIENKQEVS